MARAKALAILIGAAALGLVLVSGGSAEDPRTPPALPGEPAPFLGTAVAGEGQMTAAVDAYGDVVDLRPSPAGPALIYNPSARQAAGSVSPDTGIVPKARIGGRWLPMWRASSVRQRYLPGTSVVRTVARFGRSRVVMVVAAAGRSLAVTVRAQASAGTRLIPRLSVNTHGGLRCARGRQARQLDLLCGVGRAVPPALGAAARDIPELTSEVIRESARGDRRWLSRARPLGAAAPGWAKGMYARSLLVLHALTDRHTGAVAAGARDGWAYVWPRDAATAALALDAAGYAEDACRVASFLAGLDLNAAARFDSSGDPVPGRGPEGDAAGWVDVAVRASASAGASASTVDGESPRKPAGGGRPESCPGLGPFPHPIAWRNRPDYREGPRGDYLANAIAATALDGPKSQNRQADGPKSSTGIYKSARRPQGVDISARRFEGLEGAGMDAAEGWAVRPFGVAALYPQARRTMVRLAAHQTRFGITPGADWTGGPDPWTAPTAWTAWSFAALAGAECDARAGAGRGARGRACGRRSRADRRQALRLLGDLRRAATPAGDLPERVGAATGIARSTTPLAWSHAFAVLTLRQLWPGPTGGASAAARSAGPGAAHPAHH